LTVASEDIGDIAQHETKMSFMPRNCQSAAGYGVIQQHSHLLNVIGLWSSDPSKGQTRQSYQ
jgi:hypothetical protein